MNWTSNLWHLPSTAPRRAQQHTTDRRQTAIAPMSARGRRRGTPSRPTLFLSGVDRVCPILAPARDTELAELGELHGRRRQRGRKVSHVHDVLRSIKRTSTRLQSDTVQHQYDRHPHPGSEYPEHRLRVYETSRQEGSISAGAFWCAAGELIP